MVESRHRASYAVVDVDGHVIESHGYTGPVYPRSAIKPIQALPLVETGAADHFNLNGAELALACASHSGEPEHVATVAGLLARIGLSDHDLECGAHLPYHTPSAHALIRAGQAPSALYNNCSGKHTAMLVTARHLGEPTKGYIVPEHPVQRRVVRAFEEMCGVSLDRSPRGTDGCGLPQIGMPLEALARGMAKFGAPDRLEPARATACRRLAEAMIKAPNMVAGSGRFCTRALEIAGGKAVLKGGAEGMYMAAIPASGIGIAIKVEDGAGRAAEVTMATLLLRYAGLDDEQRRRVEALASPAIQNVAGKQVGEIVLAPGF